MPPKKRRVPPPPKKVGVMRCHLDEFVSLPGSVESLKNGHVLKVYIDREKSLANTARHLANKYKILIRGNQVEPVVARFKYFFKYSDQKKKIFFMVFVMKLLPNFNGNTFYRR